MWMGTGGKALKRRWKPETFPYLFTFRKLPFEKQSLGLALRAESIVYRESMG